MACKVFVGSLPIGTKPKELRHLFQNFGIVIECDVKNRCGFVHMETPTMAETAILTLNGSEFKGQMINVERGRSKDTQTNMLRGPTNNMFFDRTEQFAPRDVLNFPSGGSRGFRGGGGGGGRPTSMGGPFKGALSNRGGGGIPSQARGAFNRGDGSSNQGGGMSSSFNNNRDVIQNRAGMGDRPVSRGFNAAGRGAFNNRNESDGGPIRNTPSFKQRGGPYSPVNGNGRGEAGQAVQEGKFAGNSRGGFNGPPNRNQHTQQRSNNWGQQNNTGEASSHFENRNSRGSGFGGGNIRNANTNLNFGQDRRGFTLDNAQLPLPTHHQQQHQSQQNFGGVGNRGPNHQHHNFHSRDSGDLDAGFGNSNIRDRPPQRGNGGVRGNFGLGQRGSRGNGGRGNFAGGRGGGTGSSNFGPPRENYNQDFPALQPSRGRGSFSAGNRGGGGSRGGFNRNAPNMMPNRRQNM